MKLLSLKPLSHGQASHLEERGKVNIREHDPQKQEDFSYIETLDNFPSGFVSHYSTIGDAISCDAPHKRAIGFRGKFFVRCPPCQVCLWIAIGHFYRKKWGSLRCHRKHSATGVLLHLSRDRGDISVGSLSFPQEGLRLKNVWGNFRPQNPRTTVPQNRRSTS